MISSIDSIRQGLQTCIGIAPLGSGQKNQGHGPVRALLRSDNGAWNP